MSVQQGGILGLNELDSLDELLASLEVKLLKRVAEDRIEDGQKLGRETDDDGVLLEV
jgi:hypothetical protein